MRECPKSIDKPFLYLGLELEEIGAVFLVFFFFLNITYFFVAFIFAILSWIIIFRVRKGKPEGALLHFLYKRGIPFQGLLPPPTRGAVKYSCFLKN